MRKLFFLLCFLSYSTLFAQTTVQSTPQTHSIHTPIKIGDEVPLQLETAHPYNQAGQHGVVFEQEFYNKNSSYIKLYFENFDLGPEDYVEISTHNTGESIIYGGQGKIIDQNGTMISTFWSQALLDEKVTVRLHAVGGANSHSGFKISRVAYGYSEAQIAALVDSKSICGSDDKERIACYAGTTMFEKSKAVCRLLINGSGLCTGWLLGCEGHLMTNNHCIGTASDAANTDFLFNYQYSGCTGTGNASSSVVASSSTFIKTSPFSSSGLDYTLVKLPVNPTATYGYLSLSSAAPSVGDRIYIPQHPGGRRKEISVVTDQGGTAQGFSMINQINTNGARYFADTEGGSSGSPVIDYNSNLVVAIHNTGGCTNGSYGRSDKLIAHIAGDMPNCGVDNSGGSTGGGCTNTISNFPYNEGFNGTIGAWTQSSSDNTNWTVRSGSTPSNNTGPAASNEGSHYIYVESSSPQYPSKSAVLNSPCFDFSGLSSSAVITFDYHMYGASMGTLRLEASTNGGSSWSMMWTQTGDKGNSWQSANFNIGSLAGNSSVQLRFVGITGSSWQSDMAIDKFSINNGSVGSGCYSSFPYTQNFENTIAGWTQSTADDFNWALRSGSTPSSNTGPSSAYQGSYYLYIESSSPNYSTKQAILNSQCYNLSGLSSGNVSFRYHMYGASNMGDLKLQISIGGGWTTIWSRAGNQGNSWQLASVNINAYTASSSVYFRFVGTTGTTWQGDMAIDAFTITGAPESATVETVELEETPYLTVSPNPFQTYLNISTNMEGLEQYRLVNIQGQVVKEGLVQGNHLELGNLSQGVYFITFYNAEEQVVRKIIKQ